MSAIKIRNKRTYNKVVRKRISQSVIKNSSPVRNTTVEIEEENAVVLPVHSKPIAEVDATTTEVKINETLKNNSIEKPKKPRKKPATKKTTNKADAEKDNKE